MSIIDNTPSLFHAIPEEDENEDVNQKMRNSSVSSCCIDIHGQRVNADILVALLDRPREIKELISRNSQFYDVLEHYITETQGLAAWDKFQEVINKPREKMCDRVWMSHISHYLKHNPVFLNKFKEIVGYTDDEDSDSNRQTVRNTNTRRKSRRLSSMSVGDVLNYSEDEILEEEAPQIPDGMFTNESQFYHTNNRRRSSYHSFQSQPHPTFFDGNIAERDDTKLIAITDAEDDSDHLSELIDDEDDDGDDDDIQQDSHHKEIGAGISTTANEYNLHHYNEMDLIKLRDYPEFQTNLPMTHASFFRKAKQLLSTASSSKKLSTKIHRNSILEDVMPSTPLTEMDEPLFQTCDEPEEDNENGNLVNIICATRRQQPDDNIWLNSVIDVLSGWPELVDGLIDIIHHSIAEHS